MATPRSTSAVYVARSRSGSSFDDESGIAHVNLGVAHARLGVADIDSGVVIVVVGGGKLSVFFGPRFAIAAGSIDKVNSFDRARLLDCARALVADNARGAGFVRGVVG